MSKKYLQVLVLFYLSTTVFGLAYEGFKKIATYSSVGDKFKEVYLATSFRLSWINSNMACLNHGMELLRIESDVEFLAVEKALKLFWLNFDGPIFIDGYRTNSGKWKFISNGLELDAKVLNFSAGCTNAEYVTLMKDGKNKTKICSNDYSNKKFLCQKVFDGKYISEHPDTLKVTVIDKMFEYIGTNYDGRKFYINRMKSFNLSPLTASGFCEAFGLRLTKIQNMAKLEKLISFLNKKNERLEKFFITGDLRSDLNEHFNFFHLIDYSLSSKESECIAISVNHRLIRRQPTIHYFDCNNPHWRSKLNFICEFDPEHIRKKSNLKKTNGMKFIGSIQAASDNFVSDISYFVNDVVSVTSWFEAFLYCKSLGMNLFNPRNKTITDKVNKLLNEEKCIQTFTLVVHLLEPNHSSTPLRLALKSILIHCTTKVDSA